MTFGDFPYNHGTERRGDPLSKTEIDHIVRFDGNWENTLVLHGCQGLYTHEMDAAAAFVMFPRHVVLVVCEVPL